MTRAVALGTRRVTVTARVAALRLQASVGGLCIMAVRNFEVFQARPRRFEPLSLTPRLPVPVGFQWEPAY